MFTYPRNPSDNASQMFSSNSICYLLVPIHNILLSRPSKADSPPPQCVHSRSVPHPAASGQRWHPRRSTPPPNCDWKQDHSQLRTHLQHLGCFPRQGGSLSGKALDFRAKLYLKIHLIYMDFKFIYICTQYCHGWNGDRHFPSVANL